jgi:hypothetical protein
VNQLIERKRVSIAGPPHIFLADSRRVFVSRLSIASFKRTRLQRNTFRDHPIDQRAKLPIFARKRGIISSRTDKNAESQAACATAL